MHKQVLQGAWQYTHQCNSLHGVAHATAPVCTAVHIHRVRRCVSQCNRVRHHKMIEQLSDHGNRYCMCHCHDANICKKCINLVVAFRKLLMALHLTSMAKCGTDCLGPFCALVLVLVKHVFSCVSLYAWLLSCGCIHFSTLRILVNWTFTKSYAPIAKM